LLTLLSLLLRCCFAAASLLPLRPPLAPHALAATVADAVCTATLPPGPPVTTDTSPSKPLPRPLPENSIEAPHHGRRPPVAHETTTTHSHTKLLARAVQTSCYNRPTAVASRQNSWQPLRHPLLPGGCSARVACKMWVCRRLAVPPGVLHPRKKKPHRTNQPP
jgi:hypothetical protein